MKILHITTIDIGGAYQAAARLNSCMKQMGLQSSILVRTKTQENSQVISAFHSRMQELVSKIKNGINLLFAQKDIAKDVLGTDVSMLSGIKEADVIILHWVNSFLTMKEVEKLSRLGKPIIWIMHDMWLFTGGCHVDGYCGRYHIGCGKCPYLGCKKEKDLTYKNCVQKRDSLLNLPIYYCGPSEWIVRCAAESFVLKNQNIQWLPNTIDTKKFLPLYQKENLKEQYGITVDEKVVLFGAADAGTENENKGFRYLREALWKIPEEYRKQIVLVVFGNTGKELNLPKQCRIIKTGFITEEEKLAEIYNMADVFVNPSSQESFGYTVCEAMACGVPVAAFPIGGIKEQITHKQNGYLADFRNAEDLANGIMYCLENTEELGKKARESALKYSYEEVGKKYLNLMKEVTEK